MKLGFELSKSWHPIKRGNIPYIWYDGMIVVHVQLMEEAYFWARYITLIQEYLLNGLQYTGS